MLQDQFLLFAGTLPEPLFLLTDEGEILEANAAAHRLLGVAARGLRGIKLHDLAQEDSGKLDQCLRLWARSREMLPAALHLRHADGGNEKCHCGGALIQPRSDELPALILLRSQPKQVLTRGFVALNEQIERLRKEITVRKHAEKSLQESEAHLRALIETLPDLVWLKDPDGVYLTCNPKFERFFGAKQSEIVGRTDYDFVDKELADFFREHDKASMAAGRPSLNEEEVTYADDGHKELIETIKTPMLAPDGKLIGVLGVGRDITERKHAEQKLQLQAAALESAANGIVITNRAGEIQWVNPTFTAMTGYGLEEAVGQSTRLLRSGKQDKKFYQELWDTILSGRVWKGELINRRKDGSLYIDEQSITPVCNEQGKITHFVAIKQDITERKQAEEELEKHREHLEELVAERTAALEAANKELESFSYSVSHDLRAPLRAIDGFSRAVLEDYGSVLDGQGRQYLERVHAGAQRMSILIDDLLRLSRVTRAEPKMVQVDLSAVAQAVIQELTLSEPGRETEVVIAPALRVRADDRLMRVMLENLLGNAWKFTGKKADTRIEFGQQEQDGESVFYVRDNGTGFDMRYADKLFGAFQRLHKVEEFPGTGIGLATVARIIRRHGGRVWAEGEVDKGATFYFTLGTGNATL
jgi:PAS domain S-box-containing protein